MWSNKRMQFKIFLGLIIFNAYNLIYLLSGGIFYVVHKVCWASILRSLSSVIHGYVHWVMNQMFSWMHHSLNQGALFLRIMMNPSAIHLTSWRIHMDLWFKSSKILHWLVVAHQLLLRMTSEILLILGKSTHQAQVVLKPFLTMVYLSFMVQENKFLLFIT